MEVHSGSKPVTVKCSGKAVNIKLTKFPGPEIPEQNLVERVWVSKSEPGYALLEYKQSDGICQCLLYKGVQHIKVSKDELLKKFNPVSDLVAVGFIVLEHNKHIIENMMPLIHEEKFRKLRDEAIIEAKSINNREE